MNSEYSKVLEKAQENLSPVFSLLPGTIERWKDADTAVIVVKQLYGEVTEVTVRLEGVYAFEKTLRGNQTEEEKSLGIAAAEKVEELFPKGTEIIVKTRKIRSIDNEAIGLDLKQGYWSRYISELFHTEVGSINEYIVKMEEGENDAILSYEEHVQHMQKVYARKK